MKRLLLRLTERVAFYTAHRVLCVSHSLRDLVVSEGLCPPEKVQVLLKGSGNGVDAVGRFNPGKLGDMTRAETRTELGIPASARVVGFVGRIVKDKGIVELEKAWTCIRSEFPDAHLLMVGPVEPYDPVPEPVLSRLRHDQRVHFTGVTNDLPRYYSAMDLLVLPTYREGFGNVLIEASAMELPVVSTKIPGPIDAVVDGVTGTLVPVHDVNALVTAIRKYLLDSSLAGLHGRAGRQRVLAEFRPESIWAALFEEYTHLLCDRTKGIPLDSEIAP